MDTYQQVSRTIERTDDEYLLLTLPMEASEVFKSQLLLTTKNNGFLDGQKRQEKPKRHRESLSRRQKRSSREPLSLQTTTCVELASRERRRLIPWDH